MRPGRRANHQALWVRQVGFEIAVNGIENRKVHLLNPRDGTPAAMD